MTERASLREVWQETRELIRPVRARYLGDNTYPPSVGDCEPLQVVESVTAQKANQTISFEPLTTKTYGDPDIPIVALASSGLPVSPSSSSRP